MVNHSQKIRKSLTGGQRTHHIDVNVRKPPGKHRVSWNCRLNVSRNFTLLTSETRPCPQAQTTRKARPNKLRKDQPPGGPDTKMGNIMKQVEELLPELERNQRAKRSGRGVTE